MHHDIGPPLQRSALEHRQEAVGNVVKIGQSVVETFYESIPVLVIQYFGRQLILHQISILIR